MIKLLIYIISLLSAVTFTFIFSLAAFAVRNNLEEWMLHAGFFLGMVVLGFLSWFHLYRHHLGLALLIIAETGFMLLLSPAIFEEQHGVSVIAFLFSLPTIVLCFVSMHKDASKPVATRQLYAITSIGFTAFFILIYLVRLFNY